MWKAPSALSSSRGCCGQVPITDCQWLSNPSSCNLSCTATGCSQEAAANQTALCGDFVLPQNIPTVGCGELIPCVLPCKLMEPEPQLPRAMISNFNPWETKLQVLNLLCWQSDFVTPGWLLVLVGPPSWMATVGAFREEEKTSGACNLLHTSRPSFWKTR